MPAGLRRVVNLGGSRPIDAADADPDDGCREISDPARIVGICDVFSALLERRAYKPPLASQVAYQTLLDMGDKLDRDLVREVGFTRTLRLDAAA